MNTGPWMRENKIVALRGRSDRPDRSFTRAASPAGRDYTKSMIGGGGGTSWLRTISSRPLFSRNAFVMSGPAPHVTAVSMPCYARACLDSLDRPDASGGGTANTQTHRAPRESDSTDI